MSAGPKLTRVAPFNIDAEDVVASRAIICGREHDVLQITAGDMRFVGALQENPEAGDLETLIGVAHRCVPTLTREEVEGLRPHQIGMILGAAQVTAKEIEAQVPNAEGPTAATHDSPPA